MDKILAYLPQHEGYLPSWLLFISAVSVFNSVQCYFNADFSRRVYNASGSPPKRAADSSSAKKRLPMANSPVNPLSARTFGTWTLLSSVVRLYAAYHVDNPGVYQLALWSYGVAWFHFMSEWLVFGTANMGPGLASPMIVSTTSFLWMLNQRDFYLH